jgi:hypothetical protein
MAINQGTVLPIFLSTLAANTFLGISAPQLATGLANAITAYALSGITVSSVDVGVLGVGAGTGFGIVLPSSTLSASFTGTFPANTIAGPMTPALINAVSLGFMQVFAIANIITVNPTVGVGAGEVSLVPNPSISIPAFIGGFSAAGMVGVASQNLARAIAIGLDSVLPSAFGVIAIAGSPSIISSAGVGVGKIL